MRGGKEKGFSTTFEVYIETRSRKEIIDLVLRGSAILYHFRVRMTRHCFGKGGSDSYFLYVLDTKKALRMLIKIQKKL